jgi:hypothetical protein
MGRYRRRNYRRNKTVTKARAKSKTGAKSQASQILKLQKQITTINRKVVDNTKWTQYSLALNATVGAVTAPTYSVWNLIQPNLWTPIFQTRNSGTVDALTPSKFRGRSIGLEIMAQLGAITGVTLDMSQEPVTATIFICSLRKETAKQFIDETTNGTAMTPEVHYHLTSLGNLQGAGLAMLNKGYFKIRYVKRFMLGGVTNFYGDDAGMPDDKPQATTSLKDNNKRFYIKIPYKNLIKDAGPNSRVATAGAGFKTPDIDEVEPMDQLYVFCFSNAYADQAVSLHANMVITGTTAN